MVLMQFLFCCIVGSVSELVAHWLSSAGLDPHKLVDLSDVEFDNLEDCRQCPEQSVSRNASSIDIKEGSKPEVEQGAEALPANEHESNVLG
jgi:hypothetical protein